MQSGIGLSLFLPKIIVLAQRFIKNDRDCVGEIQRAQRPEHRYADSVIVVAINKAFRKSTALSAKEDETFVRIVNFGVALFGFDGGVIEFAVFVFLEELIEVLVINYFDLIPVIETRPANGFFAYVET